MDEEHNDMESPEEESFEQLLAQSLVATTRLEPGQKVEATVLKIAADWIFLDVGQKGEGVLDKRELLDAEGRLTVAEGEKLNVYFLSRSGGELRFTAKIGGGAGLAQIEEAWRNGIPVDGRVVQEVKGGYEVRLGGNLRAFCPYSQMGLRRSESPEACLNQQLPFRVTSCQEQGRNIVVSHRAILEEERRKQREALRDHLKEGMHVKGTVTQLQKFGAFVDIGGIEGLVPISEVGWGRVEEISEVLHVGQEVEVAVKKLDWEAERFSFSLRETLANPWQMVAQKYPIGSVHTGKVARLAPFGAFVTLEEGVDGLVHISRLGGGKRIQHPREVVQEGQSLPVVVEQLDLDQRRISLALAGDAEEPVDLGRYAQEAPSGMGTLGDLLKAREKKKGRKR